MAKEFDVAVQIKIYVDEPSKSASVKGAIEKLAKVQKFWEEDVGFGIKALKALLLMCDSDGGMDTLEEKLQTIEGVSQVEIESISRV